MFIFTRQQDPADRAFAVLAAFTAVLGLLFASLKIAGVTDWSWWAVMTPAIVLGGILALAVLMVLGWAWLWNHWGDG